MASLITHTVSFAASVTLAISTCSEAGPGVPMWPDPEDAQQAAAAAAAATESFAFAPPWLVSAWAQRGAPGFWATDPPQARRPATRAP